MFYVQTIFNGILVHLYCKTEHLDTFFLMITLLLVLLILFSKQINKEKKKCYRQYKITGFLLLKLLKLNFLKKILKYLKLKQKSIKYYLSTPIYNI